MFEILAILTGATAAVLLGPLVFSGGESPESPSLETLEGSRALVVPPAPGVSHPFWVKTRGELWRAEIEGPTPAPGNFVEVARTDGLLLHVNRVSDVAMPRPKTAWWRSVSNTKLAFGFWAVSCLFCWVALGSPLYSLVGVPGVWVVVLGSLATVDG